MLTRIAGKRGSRAPVPDPDPSTFPAAWLRPSPTPPEGVALRGLTRARLARLLGAFRPHLPLLLADLACAVVVSATALLLPLCANVVTRGLAEDGPDVLRPILLTGAVMLALLALQAVCTFFVDFQGHMMGTRMEASLRRELFEHCQALSFGFHDSQRVGQLMSRITNDSFHLGELYHHGPEDLVIAVLKTVGVIAILTWLDGPLTLLILAVLPVAILHALHFSRRMNRAMGLATRRIGIINECVEDSLAGVKVVQSFANEALESYRFGVENDRFVESRREGYRSGGFFSVGTVAFPQLITVLVITVGAVRVTQGALDVPDLLTFLLCVAVLYDPVQRLANLVRLWQEGMPGFVRMMEILEVEPAIRDRPGARHLARPRGLVRFENAGFRYEADGPRVLGGLSFSIRPGEFVALVGASGVGKSTLVSLIPRFHDATEGRVLIDGIDVRDASLASLRRAVGVVQQDVYLFAGTVRENIRYGRLDASEAEIVSAAESADAHDFILSLPHGYDTDVGQRGVRLSGGQRQRLSMARAFLKDPSILILDEATSALDAASERAVQGALARLARGRTTLVIAHRLSTIRHADRILVLTADGIAEEGRHDDLMALSGAYARLQTG